MVFQSFALFPWMTAQENIEAALAPRGMSREEMRTRAQQVIKLVGLSGFGDSYPRELSGGMKQRIGIARGIAVDRPLLFMDEPFSQVDALTAESRASARSVVASRRQPRVGGPDRLAYDIKEVVYMADRIVLLAKHPGRIRAIVENTLPRPRDYRSPGFLRLVDHIHDIITGHEPARRRSARRRPRARHPPRSKQPLVLEPVPDARPRRRSSA